jgi:hypothetical protein
MLVYILNSDNVLFLVFKELLGSPLKRSYNLKAKVSVNILKQYIDLLQS